MVSVKNVMSKPVITIDSSASISEAAAIMKERKISCLLAVDARAKPSGIVTETDIIYKIVAEKKSFDTSVKDVMTQDIKTIKEDETIEQAAKIMAAHLIRRLPVMKNKELVGIVTLKDVVKAKRVNNESEYYPYFS